MNNRFRGIAIAAGSVALIAVVACIGAGLAWFKYRQIADASQQGAPPEAPESVTISSAKSVPMRLSVTAIGTIRAPRSITLQNELAGMVTSIGFQAGDVVEAGQVLVNLDHRVEDAMLLSALAKQKMAKSMLERNRRVALANASSANEIDQAEADMAQGDAEVARLKAVIEKKTLVAPFRAKTGLIDTHVGQFLSEGTQLTTLQGIDDYVEVDFMMPQFVADAVEIGQTVSLLLPPEVLEAELIAMDAIADRSTRNLLGRARLKNPPRYLQPNDAVKVQVHYGTEMTVVAVPAEAIRRSPAHDFVYVAQPDHTGGLRALHRRVELGQTLDNDVVISSGIEAGESVVVNGSFKLHDNALVVDLRGGDETDSDASITRASL